MRNVCISLVMADVSGVDVLCEVKDKFCDRNLLLLAPQVEAGDAMLLSLYVNG